MQVRKQQLELDMEQQTGSKQEKEYVKAVYCHPAYLTSMQCMYIVTELNNNKGVCHLPLGRMNPMVLQLTSVPLREFRVD